MSATDQSKRSELTIAPAILDREIILQQKHLLAYWQNRALVLAQQIEDMRASLEEKVKEAIEAKVAELGKAKDDEPVPAPPFKPSKTQLLKGEKD